MCARSRRDRRRALERLPGARVVVVHVAADEPVPVRVRPLLRQGGLPGRRGRGGGADPRCASGRGDAQRDLPGGRRSDRPADGLSPALLDGDRLGQAPSPVSGRAAAGTSATRCSPRRPSRAATATTSRRRQAASGAGGCASARESASTCAPPTSRRARTANDAQCAELAALLDRRAATRTVIFGGDVNRSRACAARAGLDPGRRFRRPGPGAPVRVRNRRAPLALGSGAAGQAHRPRLPARPRAPHPEALGLESQHAHRRPPARGPAAADPLGRRLPGRDPRDRDRRGSRARGRPPRAVDGVARLARARAGSASRRSRGRRSSPGPGRGSRC